MAHMLERLLGSTDPLFATALVKLAQSARSEGVDVRLIADITHTAHQIMRTLQLDPANSTALEVYSALRAHVAKTEREELLTTDYIIFIVGRELISFNAVDLLDDIRHNRQFTSRTFDHARRALLGEITHRYTVHPSTHEPTVRALLSKEPNNIEQPVVKEKVMAESYVLAIGDIFTDAFIKLNEEVARVETDENGDKRLSLPLGSKPPYDGVDIVQGVGPAPNAAVSTARLGVKTGLVSFLGDDQVGKDAIEYLKTEHILTDSNLYARRSEDKLLLRFAIWCRTNDSSE